MTLCARESIDSLFRRKTPLIVLMQYKVPKKMYIRHSNQCSSIVIHRKDRIVN